MADKTSNSLVKDLIEAGIHFGQRSSNWNPKMGPYIYTKKNHIHIIDIKETVKGLLLAKKFLAKVVGDGKDVCFIGTKRQAREVIRQRVGDVKMHWVTERWLGGTLTNFRTIRSRLKRLEELERIEQTGEFANYSKKMESQLRREKRKILRNLEGIRHMHKLPGALVVIDVKREINAILEAKKLGIPTVCLIDTDGDPDLADIPIPGNDDSMRSIDVVVRELCAAIAEGKNQRPAPSDEKPETTEQPSTGGAAGAPRRSRRARFRADDSGASSSSSSETESSDSASDGEPAASRREEPVAAEAAKEG
ncbi:MAG: 30S ribosomal protein S2 [Phycisphaerales bacterium]